MSHRGDSNLARTPGNRPGYSPPVSTAIAEHGFERWLASYFLGAHRQIQATRKGILLAAQEDMPVLITGETGTGKDMVAQAIHAGSRRGSEESHVLAVSGLGDTAWSILFGHRRGAFTGAETGHEGVFRQADGSTLILEDIVDLPLKVQPMLLRAIEFGVFRSLGDQRETAVDVRVISTTNIPLSGEVDARRFRADLYQRVSTLRITLPPLRNHLSDLDLLVPHFLARARGVHRPLKSVSGEAMKALKNYSWPRNVRELEHLLFRASVEVAGPVIEREDVERILHEDRNRPADSPGKGTGRRVAIPIDELQRAIQEAGGNKRRAARALRIAPATLYALLRRHNVSVQSMSLEETSEERIR